MPTLYTQVSEFTFPQDMNYNHQKRMPTNCQHQFISIWNGVPWKDDGGSVADRADDSDDDGCGSGFGDESGDEFDHSEIPPSQVSVHSTAASKGSTQVFSYDGEDTTASDDGASGVGGVSPPDFSDSDHCDSPTLSLPGDRPIEEQIKLKRGLSQLDHGKGEPEVESESSEEQDGCQNTTMVFFNLAS